MEDSKKKFLILFHPLNTLYSYSFSYLERGRHIDEFNTIAKSIEGKSKEEQERTFKEKISILPYITKEVLEYYKEKKMIDCFRYLASCDAEKDVIKKEHEILGLDQYYKCQCVTLDEVQKMKENIVMISENASDFINLHDKENICKIVNWMIYKNTAEYIQYQKNTIELISHKHHPILSDLTIECFRQCKILIDYLYANKDTATIKQNTSNFFKNSINVLYILDVDSTSKLYRKRELAQSSQKVKYIPCFNKNIPIDDSLSVYPKIDVVLQRSPYFYFANRDYYLNSIQAKLDLHKEIVQLHPISIVDLLFDRYAVYDFLSKFITNSKSEIEKININVAIPYSIKYTIDTSKSSKENCDTLKSMIKEKFTYPFIIKPLSCAQHEMELIVSEKGIESLFMNEERYKKFLLSNETFIVQQFISHGGIMIKNYSINEESYSFIRPSLPDMKGDVLKTKDLSEGAMSFYNELIYQKKIDNFFNDSEKEKQNQLQAKLTEEMEKINKLSLLFVKETKITFYGLDFLYDSSNNTFYILEINYFPSYRELGAQLHVKFDEHILKYHSKYKN